MHTDPTPPSPVAGPLPAKDTRAVPERVRWYKSIESKIILCVAITTLAVNGFFTFLYLGVQARHLDETILNNATQLSETIRKSIQYDMLVNPIEKLGTPSRNRIFSSGKGYRILGMINPMYNDRDCSSAECHAHPESQKVLGVIDITMSLAGVDAEMHSARQQIIACNLLSILSIDRKST